MNKNIKSLIEDKYSVKLKKLTSGPRQFVAETFILEAEDGIKYFCKIIKYSKYAERTIQSLPMLEHLYEVGIKNINYPIKTSSGKLYLLQDNTLIILFNYINAKQTFNYSNRRLGKLIAEIHLKTTDITNPIPKEDFSLLYKDDFESFLNEALNPSKTNKYTQELQSIISQYEKEIRNDWNHFKKIIDDCKNNTLNFVLW